MQASKFLKYIGSEKLAGHLVADEELEPSRQWINTTAEKIGLGSRAYELIKVS